MLHLIMTTPNGTEVYVDLITSEVSQSIARQPQLLGLIKEALRGKTLTGTEIHIEQDMGRIVGYDYVVTTKDEDAVFYAKLLRDSTYTRFVKKGTPLTTQYVTAALASCADGTYKLQSARLGKTIPPRPGMPGETVTSKQYWTNHAVIQEGESLQPKTLCKECPY